MTKHSTEELQRQLEQTKAKVAELSDRLSTAKRKVADIESELATRACPYQPGDVLLARKYSNGKERRVVFLSASGSARWPKIHVRNIRKDGSLGAVDEYNFFSREMIEPTGERIDLPADG